MKRYIFTLALGILLSFTQCTMKDIDVNVTPNPSSKSGIHIIGAVEDFDIKSVDTRANEEVSDSHISEMTMLIFDTNNNLLQAYDANQNKLPSSHINIRKANPTFLIEATKYEGTGILASMDANVTMKYYDNTADNLAQCKIYIIANVYHLIGDALEAGEIQTIDELNEYIIDANEQVNGNNTLSMPVDANGNYIGLPMIGTHIGGTTFNLAYSTDNKNNAVATIPLKKLYSKIRFTIQVNANQIIDKGQTPKFSLNSIEVFNIPSKVRMDWEKDTESKPIISDNIIDVIGNNYLYTQTPCTLPLPSKTTVYHNSSATTDEYLEFEFYMPEHKVTPFYNRTTYKGYPDNIPDDLKQYFKPRLVAPTSVGGVPETKIAPFVRIHGTYTDHNAQINEVSYDIYLGQNEIDDFEVKRNQQLNNQIIITGLTNHKDAYPDVEGNVSIDHRVTMTSKGYNLSMEREAILDAHFEVRPLDVELSPGGSMTIIIPEQYRSWIAMESDAKAREAAGTANSSLYVDNTTLRGGVRKYFTNDLVSELTEANTGKIELQYNGDGETTDIQRIWLYIDENPNVYDETGTAKQASEGGTHTVTQNLYRLGKLNFYFAQNATPDTTATPTTIVNLQQWNLWRVWNAKGTRYYDIEHEEEYLNNYVSDAQYGGTQDGMPWGLEGIILSNSRKAAYIDANNGLLGAIIDAFGGSYDSWINSMIDESGLAPFYDFYLERDNRPLNVGFRNHSGRVFNAEIIKTLNSLYDSTTDTDLKKQLQVEQLRLIDNPQSAIAYCYHKNKRSKDGVVETANWYLPAIDEIEEISMGAYDEFDQVFQNQKYWSCQPATFNKILRVERERLGGWLGVEVQNGSYMDDNINRARATSVLFNPADPNANEAGYVNISSGVNGVEGTWVLHFEWLGGFVADESGYDPNEIGDNDKTNYKNPDHLGNLPRTEKCRIRAVYRSGTGTRSTN